MPKLLLLHGALGSSVQLEPLAELLKDKFDVYLFNFSGHGGKVIPAGGFSIKLFAEDIKYFIEKNRINGIDVYGYSMGGYAALYAARHFKGLMNKIFTTATKFQWNETTALKESKMLDPEKILEKIPLFAQQLMQRHSPVDWKTMLAETARMMINLGRNPGLKDDDLSKIENEVLLSVGDRDLMVSIEETVSVYRKLKTGSMLVIPDTLHPIEKFSLNRLTYEIEKFFLT